MPKRRKQIPNRVAEEVIFKADLLCCVCENRGHHIHHIDEDPSNNDIDNLILLCFEHHEEVTVRGGMTRKLTPRLLLRYRAERYRKVEEKRNLPKLDDSPLSPVKLDEDRLYQLMLDAVTSIEVHKIQRRFRSVDDDELLDLIHQISSYVPSSGARARQAILEALYSLAVRTSLGIAIDVARAVAQVAYDALPIRNLRKPNPDPIPPAEAELLEYGLAVGLSLSYDGALYVRNIKVVDAGGELLWRILRYVRIKNHEPLLGRVLDDFNTAEDAARRAGEKDAVTLLRLYRKHGLTGDWRNPIYGEKLLEKIT
jgi:hypothetical protein